MKIFNQPLFRFIASTIVAFISLFPVMFIWYWLNGDFKNGGYVFASFGVFVGYKTYSFLKNKYDVDDSSLEKEEKPIEFDHNGRPIL